MTALSDLREYLDTTLTNLDKFNDTELSWLLNVETGDQSARLATQYALESFTLWDLHPSPLREAILRRVARNIAMRKLPLGLAEGEAMTMRISGKDTEIRRLEAPYQRLSVG